MISFIHSGSEIRIYRVSSGNKLDGIGSYIYDKRSLFCVSLFVGDVQNRISQVTSENNDLKFGLFKAALNEAFQRHAPIKQRYVRANQAPFINKTINKEITKRSRLRKKFLNTKSDIDRNAYNKQRNLCVSSIRREKKNFFNNISTRDITDNKTFWKTVKPLFTDKIQRKSKTALIEKTSCFRRRARANSF